LQDYLGAIIVFIAFQTALITSQILPDDSLPSLVGLALQYTLLIPIYLNWVVKLFADMEMYFGACERISYCIENDYQEMDAVNVCMCIILIAVKGEVTIEDKCGFLGISRVNLGLNLSRFLWNKKNPQNI